MSLGSDIINALKVRKKEGATLAIIVAVDRETLKTISPNDAAALVSLEKLQAEIRNLDGAMDIPLLYGSLTPASKVSKLIEDELKKSRPRDITVPMVAYEYLSQK